MEENHTTSEFDAHFRYEVSAQGETVCSRHGGHKAANQYAKCLAELNGVPYAVTDTKTKSAQVFNPSDKAAAKRKEWDNSPIRRLQAAIEGEYEDLCISDEQAKFILDYTRDEQAINSHEALVAFRSEVERIRDDYHPDRPQDAAQALQEMRDALSAALSQARS